MLLGLGLMCGVKLGSGFSPVCSQLCLLICGLELHLMYITACIMIVYLHNVYCYIPTKGCAIDRHQCFIYWVL